MKRLVLILGSGSSVPYGFPDSGQLTGTVTVGGTYLDSKVDYSRAGAETKENVERWPVTEMLWEALRGNYEQPNFETYVHALETLEPLAASRRIPKYYGTLDEYRPIYTAFMEVLGRYEPFMRSEVLQTERLNVLIRILDSLNFEPYSVTGKQRRVELDKTLKQIGSRFQTNVLSLNYDDLIDETLADYFDGFTIPWQETALRFDRADFLRKELPDQSMLHLHGSVRFGYLRNENELLPEIVKYRTRNEAVQSVRDAIADPQAVRGDAVYGGKIYSTAPIISGIQKADKLMLSPSPFGYYYHAAIKQILATKRVLIVGYGCRDPHINTWIREAAEIQGDDYRVVFVTHVPKRLRLRYTNFERLAISIFLAPVESTAYESWYDPGPDLLSFGKRLLVIRSGAPISTEMNEVIMNFLA